MSHSAWSTRITHEGYSEYREQSEYSRGVLCTLTPSRGDACCTRRTLELQARLSTRMIGSTPAQPRALAERDRWRVPWQCQEAPAALRLWCTNAGRRGQAAAARAGLAPASRASHVRCVSAPKPGGQTVNRKRASRWMNAAQGSRSDCCRTKRAGVISAPRRCCYRCAVLQHVCFTATWEE